MTLAAMLDQHRPISIADLCRAIEQAGAVDAFEADGLIIFVHEGRMSTVPATPGDVLAVADKLRGAS